MKVSTGGAVMKNPSKSFLLLFLIFSMFLNLGAAEKMPVETVTVPNPGEELSSGSFDGLVPMNEKLVSKPGPVFTEANVSSEYVLPSLVSDPTPILYPSWAVNRGWEGELIIAVEILTDGSVGRYKVMRSTGRRLLDRAAIRAVRTWKFHPATEGGKAVVSCIQIPVLFRLENE